MAKNSGLTAKWIWKKQDSYNPYQQVVVAKKHARLSEVEQAHICISADGSYRLMINGEWVNDGPCRSWPEHFQYDRIDVSSYIVHGENEIVVIARHWSVGNFHTVPRQAGILIQLDLVLAGGRRKRIVSDESWQVAEAHAWVRETPKVSIQMEPQELYDGRLEGELRFEPARVLFGVGEGPWQDLRERDVALLTRKPLPFRSFLEANLVERNKNAYFCVPTARLANPGAIEANHSTSNAGGMASVLELDEPAVVKLVGEGFVIGVDGQVVPDGNYTLAAGAHFVLAMSGRLFGHDKDRLVSLVEPPPCLRLANPLNESDENLWCWVDMPEYAFLGDDMIWPSVEDLNGQREQLAGRYIEEVQRLLEAVKDKASFMRELGKHARSLAIKDMFVIDTHAPFLARKVLRKAADLVHNPAGLMYENGEVTVIAPSQDGDIELVYDFGEQSVGYYDLELIAEAGVEVDIFGVEYIDSNGTIQHTLGNRNGMRYITREGANRFISHKRRAQRYLFITLRQQTRPVRIRKIQLIESTYPVNYIGSFDCSDSRLAQIYEISARTLKLCMEDTFTDCPLYEQTHWVGDARNESVFNYSIFGAEDIARRCIRLTAQSLERYPIVGCQVPSGWDCLLPAWSFMWGISVWDYYLYSGDRAFLAELWPAVLRNLQGAEVLLNNNGLFSGPFWNMFDWSGIDDRHATVLHNSMFMVGAINAAIKSAKLLGKRKDSRWLAQLRQRLVSGLNALWNPDRKVYPDSVYADGTVSERASVHTSFLAILYDIVRPGDHRAALNNVLAPAADMVKVGSPFAILYLYEALEKVGLLDKVLESIYANYLPMLEEGATTVWEVFSTSGDRPSGFPTRSHCHAWSSAPVQFLPKIVLGIQALEPRGGLYEISPRIGELTWARGGVPSPAGVVNVEWKLEGKKLTVRARGPETTWFRFKPNETLQGLELILDIDPQENA